jgi:hypothetical protein
MGGTLPDCGAGAEPGTEGVLQTGLASGRVAIGLGAPASRGRGLASPDHLFRSDENTLARTAAASDRFGKEVEEILATLPQVGPLFPYLQTVRAGDRATEFKQRCVGLGIQGVSLHSYRYAWAERAKTCGYPERFAQLALGHNSKAVHRAYAKKAQVTLPPLEEYEREHEQKVVPLVNAPRHEPIGEHQAATA